MTKAYISSSVVTAGLRVYSTYNRGTTRDNPEDDTDHVHQRRHPAAGRIRERSRAAALAEERRGRRGRGRPAGGAGDRQGQRRPARPQARRAAPREGGGRDRADRG